MTGFRSAKVTVSIAGGQELQRVDGGGAGRGSVGFFGAVSHLLERGIVAHPLQRDGVAGAAAGQPPGKGAVVLRHADASMDVKARVGPLEDPLLVLVDLGTKPASIVESASYSDQLVKTAQGWRFKRRVVVSDQVASPRPQ